MFVRIDDVGRILSTVTTDPKFADIYPDFIWVDAEAIDWDGHYVSEGQVLTRPDPESAPVLSAADIPADGVSVLTVTGIPIGALVQVSGPVMDEWIEDSGSAELSVDVPGRYVIKVEKWPQKSVEVSFHAT